MNLLRDEGFVSAWAMCLGIFGTALLLVFLQQEDLYYEISKVIGETRVPQAIGVSKLNLARPGVSILGACTVGSPAAEHHDYPVVPHRRRRCFPARAQEPHDECQARSVFYVRVAAPCSERRLCGVLISRAGATYSPLLWKRRLASREHRPALAPLGWAAARGTGANASSRRQQCSRRRCCRRPASCGDAAMDQSSGRRRPQHLVSLPRAGHGRERRPQRARGRRPETALAGRGNSVGRCGMP